MSKLILSFFVFLFGIQSSTWASLNLHGEPLFSGATSFTFTVSTTMVTKPTSCFVTSGEVSQCRRKRGIEESPFIVEADEMEIAPSVVYGVEPTVAPRGRSLGAFDFYNANKVYSSMDDSYFNSQNIFRQLATRGRNNVISVGDCGMSTVNFSQFLSCLGMTVQETTTLTATFTETSTFSSGYTTMTVAGCTPAGFPYQYCPQIEITYSSTGTVVDSTIVVPPVVKTPVG